MDKCSNLRGSRADWCNTHNCIVWDCIESKPEDPINPSYYKGDTVMRIIEDFNLDFPKGTAIKYILRAGNKSTEYETKDLRKSLWYIRRRIQQILLKEDYVETGLIYLASPITHPDASTVKLRFLENVNATCHIFNQGRHVFSPAVHSYHLQEIGGMGMTWECWAAYDRAIIELCAEIYILQIPGWERSVGVKAEVEIANELELPILFMIPTEEGYLITPVEGDKVYVNV